MKKLFTTVLLSSAPFYVFASTLEEKARAGDVKAIYQLAEYYENKQDFKNAMLWYKKVANQAIVPTMQAKTVIVDNPSDETIAVANVDEIKQMRNDPHTSDSLSGFSHSNDNDLIELLDSSLGLRPYHSNYILPISYDSRNHDDGRKHVETTFQLSFKKDIFNNAFGYDETIGFAYTQRNWWQITESSSPFRETNYLPEFYLQIPYNDADSFYKGTQVGFLHESNGQGDENGKSRSWNRLYLESYINVADAYLVPRVWYRIHESRNKDDNHDIQDYLGYGDLNVYLPYDKHLVKLLIRNNLKFNDNHGAIQADWTYPLGDTGLYGYVQYFYGYGESLIDYDKKVNRIGIGVALSR
ncbi:phospholipase A [Orbaceae bacterium ac157xtp]